MKVKLRRKGKLVAELEVLEDGALRILTASGDELALTVRDSRRLAGAIVENSVAHTAKSAHGQARKHAHSIIDRLLDGLGEGETGE